MTAFAEGKIEAYYGPQELGAPDNLEQVIVDFIGGAKKSLDIAVQELDNPRIAQAILDARWRGVAVDMFLEQDYLRSPLLGSPPKPPKPLAGETPETALLRVQWGEDASALAENRRLLSGLLRSDIQVRGDYNPKIFHQKFALRDYRDGKAQPTAALLSGSANFTDTDTHRNLNNVFVFHSPYVCRSYETEVAQLREGQFGWAPPHPDAPPVYGLSGIPVKVLFAPDHTPELEIMKQMLTAEREVNFAIFTFAGSSGLDDTMLALARGGIKVRGALDPAQAKQKWSAPQWLKHPNIELTVPKQEGVFANLRKVHHKLMVIDDRTVIAGSFNYTQPANLYNDENIFVVGSKFDEVSGVKVDAKACKALVASARAEVDRILSLSEPFDPAKKKPKPKPKPAPAP